MTFEEIKDSLSDKEAIILTVYGEARGEPIEGQVAIVNVIKTRARKRNKTLKDICFQPKQFSCWNDNDKNRPLLEGMANRLILSKEFDDNGRIEQIAYVVEGVIDNKILDNVKGSDHYMTSALFNSDKRPSWAKRPLIDPIKKGAHVFFIV